MFGLWNVNGSNIFSGLKKRNRSCQNKKKRKFIGKSLVYGKFVNCIQLYLCFFSELSFSSVNSNNKCARLLQFMLWMDASVHYANFSYNIFFLILWRSRWCSKREFFMLKFWRYFKRHKSLMLSKCKENNISFERKIVFSFSN